MAVTTTPAMIIAAARARGIKNTATLATDATEMLQVVIRATRGLFSVAARVNPEFFGKLDSPAFALGWARPEDAESVFYIAQGGVEVAVVPFDDQGAEQGMMAVYRFAKRYQAVTGFSAPDTADPLDIYYSKVPSSPATIDATLDPLWVEQFNGLLIDETALYLALKDRRFDEVDALKLSRNDWLRLFVAFLEHETANVTRRRGQLRRITIDQLLPLLAGGA